jgi:monoamine oxidase
MTLTFDSPDGVREVSAGRVVLALPPRAMENISPDSFVLLDDRFRAALNGVVRVALGKVHLSFERAWWEQAGYGAGRTVTDLPLRQTYLWGEDAETGKGLTMASYHDGPAIEFWQALATGATYGPDNWTAEAHGPNSSPLPPSLRNTLPASRLMVDEAWYQLKKAHDIPDTAAPPILGTYRNWGDDPLYGAGIHLWAIGTDAEATMDYMREPFPGLYVCGEAWSPEQGWIKGATATAETVLQQKFGLPPYVSE